MTPEEENENHIHLLSKLCAIGYMLMEAKDSNVARAVIGMDGKQSEVGESNGRSGKSLIGELMRNVMPIAYIPGKNSDIFKDQFVWNDVMEKTKLVFIDDVLQNFNFEFLFPNITGDWSVNYKGGRRITLSFSQSPKSILPRTMPSAEPAPLSRIVSGCWPFPIFIMKATNRLTISERCSLPSGILTSGTCAGTCWPTVSNCI